MAKGSSIVNQKGTNWYRVDGQPESMFRREPWARFWVWEICQAILPNARSAKVLPGTPKCWLPFPRLVFVLLRCTAKLDTLQLLQRL